MYPVSEPLECVKRSALVASRPVGGSIYGSSYDRFESKVRTELSRRRLRRVLFGVELEGPDRGWKLSWHRSGPFHLKGNANALSVYSFYFFSTFLSFHSENPLIRISFPACFFSYAAPIDREMAT